jgi:hypothetical protein
MGVFDFLNPKKKKPTDGNDLEAVLNPAAKEKANFLSQFLPQDETKKQALAQALILGGAGMMSAAGPSSQPTNFLSSLGQGLGSGVVGYNKSLENSADTMNARTASNANNEKMQQAQAGVQFASSIGDPRGEAGYSVEQLQKIFEYQVSTGDEAGARDSLSMIQKLQQHAAGEGMIIGEDGFAVAPGYADAKTQLKRSEDAGQYTTDRKNYEYGVENPAFRKQELEDKAAGKTNMSIRTNPDGTFEMVQGAGKDGLKLTEGQSKDNVFYTRATGALKTFEPVANAMTSITDSLGGRVPLVGNYVKSDEYQQAEQSGREFLAAILRKDTGAAITDGEMSQYGQVYFPAPGDSTQTLAQKSASRQRAIDAIKNGMNPDQILKLESVGVDTDGNVSPDSTNSVSGNAAEAGQGDANVAVVSSPADDEKLKPGQKYRFSFDPPGMAPRTKR